MWITNSLSQFKCYLISILYLERILKQNLFTRLTTKTRFERLAKRPLCTVNNHTDLLYSLVYFGEATLFILHTLPPPSSERHLSFAYVLPLEYFNYLLPYLEKQNITENNNLVFWVFEIEEMKVGVKTSTLRAEEESFLSLISCKKLFSLLV